MTKFLLCLFSNLSVLAVVSNSVWAVKCALANSLTGVLANTVKRNDGRKTVDHLSYDGICLVSSFLL